MNTRRLSRAYLLSGFWPWRRCSGQLPEDQQADVIARIATLQTVQPDALRELETVMQRKFKANTSLRASQVGGVNAARRS